MRIKIEGEGNSAQWYTVPRLEVCGQEIEGRCGLRRKLPR